jgi:hypothetical protein
MTPAATSMMALIKEEMAKTSGKVEEVEKWKKESTK